MLDSTKFQVLCPRCHAPVPQRELDTGVQAEPAAPEDVDLFGMTSERIAHPDLIEEDEPWYASTAFLVGALAFFAVFFLLGTVWIFLDTDGDGLSTVEEMRAGTSPFKADSDGDRLSDGWEIRNGLDPTRRDQDGDGVPDNLEIRRGSDPRLPDTDGDSIGDDAESETDCDGDGFPAPADTDDDGDGRPDAEERPWERCTPDVDGDGVLDGHERADVCVRLFDCDLDGLRDGEEALAGFDALDPDTFDIGVVDAVPYAFQRAGQDPSSDGDKDGIPDGWEGQDGLIDWAGLVPVAGTRDLLVEFLRVQGPDSGRYGGLDFAPAYDRVAGLMAEGGITLRYVETRVHLPSEQRAPLTADIDDPYYVAVLKQARHAQNPYVTSVVMNPQHDQSMVLHLGLAPMRGMLAAVDYGGHVEVSFSDGNVTLRAQPIVENAVAAGREDIIAALGFDRGGLRSDGRVALRDDGVGYWLTWFPFWFASDPVYELDSGQRITLQKVGTEVLHGQLASTIAHELGHTLGLCHTHEAVCKAGLPAGDQVNQASSTMSYDARADTLHFLNSEWNTLTRYLTCPPAEPLTLLAEGAPASAVQARKYDVGIDELTAARSCGDFKSVVAEFNAVAGSTVVVDTAILEPVYAGRDAGGFILFLMTAAVAALAAGGIAGWWWKVRTPGKDS